MYLIRIIIASIVVSGLAWAADVTWDGGGDTENWSDAANWSGDVVPTATDVAIFDATSVKNCNLDVTPSLAGLTIAATYTGTINANFRQITSVGDVTFAGGTIDRFLDLVCGDDFMRTGGVQELDVVTLTKGSGATTLTLTPAVAGLTIDDLVVAENVSLTVTEPLTVNNDISVATNAVFTATAQVTSGDFFNSSICELSGNSITIGRMQNLTNGVMEVSGTFSFDSLFNQENLTISANGSIRLFDNNQSYSQTSNTIVTIGDRFQNSATVVMGDNSGEVMLAEIDARTATEFQNTGSITYLSPGRVRHDASLIGLTNATDDVLVALIPGVDELFVTLVDLSANENGAAADEVLVTINTGSNGDEETLLLTETTNSSGIFRNAVGLTTGVGLLGVAGDDDLVLQLGENVTVAYIDADDNADSETGALFGAAVVWDGGGDGDRWSTPENWSTDRVPSGFDAVVFNDSSVDDCDIFVNIEIKSLLIASTYTGTIDGSFRRIIVAGDCELNGGTMTGRPDLQLGGDFILNRWHPFRRFFITLLKQGVPLTTFGPAGLTIDDLTVSSGVDLELTEDLTITNALRIDNDDFALVGDLTTGSITYNGSGALTVSGTVMNGSLTTSSSSSGAVIINGSYTGSWLSVSGTSAITFNGAVDLDNQLFVNSGGAAVNLNALSTISYVDNYGAFTITDGVTVTVVNSFDSHVTGAVTTIGDGAVLDLSALAPGAFNVFAGKIEENGTGRVLSFSRLAEFHQRRQCAGQ